MLGRWLLAGVVGGVVVFFWGAVAHMALPLGTMGMSQIDPAREGQVLDALRSSIDEPGLYFLPGLDMNRTLSESEQTAWEAKLASGPSGIMVITPRGGEAMSTRQLLTEFGTGILTSLLAAGLLWTTNTSRVGGALFVAGLGLFGWLSIGVPYWNWYNFPTEFTLALLIEEVVGWFLAGLAIAAVVKPVAVNANAEGASI
ncbi:MAG: hypothetical protein AB7I30_06340 [Isosphaeraceae bacterium]